MRCRPQLGRFGRCFDKSLKWVQSGCRCSLDSGLEGANALYFHTSGNFSFLLLLLPHPSPPTSHASKPNFAKCCQIWQNSAKFCQILPISAKFCQLLQFFTKFCPILLNFQTQSPYPSLKAKIRVLRLKFKNKIQP